MANRKISDLTALTATATGDLLPIVDISEAGAADQNKKITIENLFKGIPGNVGIGTSSPGQALDVATSSATNVSIRVRNTVGVGDFYALSSGDIFVTAQNSGKSLLLGTLGAEQMRIDPSGNVGIGTTSPAYRLDVQGGNARIYSGGGDSSLEIGVGATGNQYAFIDLVGDTTYSDYGLRLIRNNAGANSNSILVHRGTGALNITAQDAGSIILATQNTERMRIDSTGSLLIQSTLYLRVAGISTSFIGYDPGAGAPTGGTLAIVNQGNDGSGSSATGVGLGRSATSWATYSDERGKTNLVPIEDGLSKVGTLRAVTGQYAEDSEQTIRSFLIAQDVQAVLPEAVDASDPDKLSLRYTEVIPLLVAALKESKERIETLEARLAAAGIA